MSRTLPIVGHFDNSTPSKSSKCQTIKCQLYLFNVNKLFCAYLCLRLCSFLAIMRINRGFGHPQSLCHPTPQRIGSLLYNENLIDVLKLSCACLLSLATFRNVNTNNHFYSNFGKDNKNTKVFISKSSISVERIPEQKSWG